MNPYNKYYEESAQTGSSFFTGERFQRGNGIGSFLANLFRGTVLPALKSGGKALGKEVLRSGVDFGADMIANDFTNPKDSLKARSKEAGDRIVQKVKSKIQSGGKRRKRRKAQVGGKRRKKIQRGFGKKKSYKSKKHSTKSSLIQALNRQLQ